MTAWFKTTSITVKAGESLATINDGAAATIFENAGGALKIASFDFVETSGLAVDSSSGKTVILLAAPWGGSTQTAKSAEGFNTAASHSQSAKILREVSEDFTAELSIREQLYSSTAETITLAMPSGATYNLRPWKKLEEDVSGAVATIPATIESNVQDKLQGIRLSTLMNPLVRLPLKNSLKGDFAGDLTFTRASAATYIDRHGVLRTAAIDEPRFEKSGYLNEGAATNLVLNSENGELWAGINVTVTSGIQASPDAAVEVVNKVLLDTTQIADYFPFFYQNVQAEAGNGYAFSAILKKGTRSTVYMQATADGMHFGARFDIDKFEVIENKGVQADVELLAGGFCKISIILIPLSDVSLSFRIMATDRGESKIIPAVADTLFAHSFQIEKNSRASSYMKTEGAPATRAADSGIKIPFAQNHPDLIGGESSTLIAFESAGGHESDKVIWGVPESATFKHHKLRLDASGNAAFYRSGISVSTLFAGKESIAVTLAGDDTKLYAAGYEVASRVSPLSLATESVMPFFVIGGGGIYGHFSDFAIHDCVLTATEIKFLQGE